MKHLVHRLRRRKRVSREEVIPSMIDTYDDIYERDKRAAKKRMSAKYDDMYSRAMHGELYQEEIASVVADLEGLELAPDPSDLISILCYTDPTKHKQRLVERFLDGPDDIAAKRALWTLCSCWDLTDQYLDVLLWYMEGTPWDDGEDCKLVAISCAGSYLKDHSSPELLRKIIETFEDENSRTRETAYRALVELTGGDWYSLPTTLDLEKYVDPAVVKKAKKRLERESG